MEIPAPESLDYRAILRAELGRRQQKNAAYSLRAFARDVSLSPAHLSAILAGKESLSLAAARRLAARLGYGPDGSGFLEILLRLDKCTNGTERRRIKGEAVKFLKTRLDCHQLQLDQFAAIADWHHLAILCAAELTAFNGSVQRIAKALGTTLATATDAVKRLARVGLANWDQHDKVKPLKSKTRTPSNVPSAAIRAFHKQVLARACDQLDFWPPEQRYIRTSLVAIPKSVMPAMQEALEETLNAFVAKFEDRPSADQVYQLSLVLMPLLNKD